MLKKWTLILAAVLLMAALCACAQDSTSDVPVDPDELEQPKVPTVKPVPLFKKGTKIIV